MSQPKLHPDDKSFEEIHSRNLSTQTMDALAPLMALPPELVALITGTVDKHDLLALRLVCHELLAAVDDVFLDTYFKTRVHLYSHEALQELIEITSHPHLVRRLEKVGVAMLSPRLPISEDNVEGLDAKVRSLWQQEVRTLADNDGATELFSIILRNLTAAGRVPAVTVSSSDGHYYADYQGHIATSRVQHMHSKLGLSGVSPQTVWTEVPWMRNSIESGTASLLHAVARTNFPLDALELRGIGSPRENARELSSSWSTWKIGNAQWQDLTVLKISWAGHVHSSDLVEVLRAATGLELLELIEDTANHEATRDILDLIRTNLATTKLRTLALKSMFALPQKKVMALFAKFAQTLRVLTLDHLDFETECWRPVLSMIEQDLHLERLEMHKLYSDRGLDAGFYTDDKGARDFVFEGGDAVGEGLEKLRKSGRYAYGLVG